MKKILGKKGTDIARSVRESVKKSLYPQKLKIHKNGKYFTVDSSINYPFWKKFQKNNWEQTTFKIFDKFLDKNHSYIDIGSWIGPTVLYGCQLSKHCYAIEPDPIAFNELKRNIDLNNHLRSRITLSDLCISNSVGTTKLFTPSETLDGGGQSGSTTLKRGLKNFWLVKTITFQQFIQSFLITDCNFIKIDIEGGEFNIIPTMLDYLKTQKPTLLVEFHSMHVKNPIEKLNEMCDVFDIYDHIFNNDLKEVDMDYILNSNPSKKFFVVLSDQI